MSKGGGGGPQETTSTVTQSNLPEYAQPYFTRLLNRTEAESTVPYTTYEGQRVAGLSPEQEMALTAKAGLGLSGSPLEFREASDIASRVGYNVPTPTFPDVDMSQYMSPYQQSVTDIELRQAQTQADQARRNLGLQAAASGGLGGYREGIEQAELARNAAQMQADIQARGLQSAYQTGMGAFEADREARLAQNQQRLSAAATLGQQGLMGQQAEIERLNQLGMAGATRQDVQQRVYDLGYQQFQDQLAYPRQQLGYYSQILRGLPVTPGTQVSTYQPQPSTAQNVLGLGLGGLGLYQAFGGGMG